MDKGEMLECCAVDPHSGKFADCKNCPLDYLKTANCFEYEIQIIALDLINRQRAEIERLTVELDAMRGSATSLKMHYENARLEIERLKDYNTGVAFKHYFDGIKEFAERLKEKAYIHKPYGLAKVVDVCEIDKLVKEMTESAI